MAAKILFVSSAIQQVLMEQVFKREFKEGFWSTERPAGHGDVWADVEVKVAEPDGQLGPVGFVSPRNYNFLNLDFFNGCQKKNIPAAKDKMVELARTVKPNAGEKHVKSELVELGQIVGGRLTSRTSTAVKLHRGNHKPGTVTASVRAARLAGKTLAEVAAAAQSNTPARTLPKATVTKVKTPTDAPVAETQAEDANAS